MSLSVLGGGAATAPEPPKAAASDIWSFGCLVAFLGTGHAPYSDEVHEAAAAAIKIGGKRGLYMLYEVVENAKAPLERLEDSLDECPKELMSLAGRCVRQITSMRPTAIQLLGQLPRETGLFDDHEGQVGHARRERTAAKVAAQHGKRTKMEKRIEEAAEKRGTAPTMVLPMASKLPAPGGAFRRASAAAPASTGAARMCMPMAASLPAPGALGGGGSPREREKSRVRV